MRLSESFLFPLLESLRNVLFLFFNVFFILRGRKRESARERVGEG